jgi:hypothetical protein
MFFRVESHDDETRRTVRTEVTVQEQQRAVLFSGIPGTAPKTCPLCGNPLFPVTTHLDDAQSQAVLLGHSKVQGACSGPGNADATKDLRQRGNSRRLR